MKQFIKRNLSKNNINQIRKAIKKIKSFLAFGNLNKLALIWNTDKWGAHWYTQHYATYFKRLKGEKLNILEIGVGGYEMPHEGGNSLRTWKHYFKKSNIYGVDIFDKKELEESRIKIFQGSQIDKDFLHAVCKEIRNGIDIIIDDGSHINSHVIETFKILFPLLKDKGIYVIEDTETAYWPEYGGDSINLNNSNTSINYFKSLLDGLNHKEFINPGYKPNYFDLNITTIHFYHNMIFVIKGENNERSVYIVDNKHHRIDS